MPRVLGIDPGTARVGWGLIEGSGNHWHMEACGLIETPSGDSAPERLESIARQLTKLVADTNPDSVAVEQLFFATNAKTAMSVAEARGVILLTLRQAKLPIYEYTGLQVKQSVTGYGQAPKNQVADMVCRLLKLSKQPKPDDVTDALAIALCHGGWAKIG